MCDECEDPNALHLTYAEKRARIRTVWQPAGKSRMGFMATCTPVTPSGAVIEPSRFLTIDDGDHSH